MYSHIEQGNGLSTFVTSIATPLDLKDQISQFFKPQKHSILLNTTTDGVSTEVQWNKEAT